jgi:hypothetical protein
MDGEPEKKVPRKPQWANSILQRNHALHCSYCGEMVRHNEWFKTRQDNGIIIIFDVEKCEKGYDAKFKTLNKRS